MKFSWVYCRVGIPGEGFVTDETTAKEAAHLKNAQAVIEQRAQGAQGL